MSIKKYIGLLIIGEIMLISMSILAGLEIKDIANFVIAYFMILLIFSVIPEVVDITKRAR